ncbi:MAG TPA: hypothetical protein EYQ81_14765 [Sneathiellales bacterium]|nr:hypothetical protein [Sneathiellales bacterium]
MAMDDFLDFVKKRKTALLEELAELEAAERVYRQSGVGSQNPMLPLDMKMPATKPTIKVAVIKLLEDTYPLGLTALEILERLNRRWWQGDLQRTSLSPQITRLKHEGKVVSERGTWKLPNKQDLNEYYLPKNTVEVDK